ncbi:MAG: hypothetical protein FWF05_00800 [Oscillospiraceae bacterium]|nr:hypothetical protein [Oscillospiraceae bacterium]
MFQTAAGVTIPFPEKISEEFQVFEKSIVFNLNFEKINSVLEEFIELLSEPLFFVLEIPLSQQEESEIRKNKSDPFHRKACYLDGRSKDQMKAILRKYGDLLLNDGISQIAVASHITNDEMFIQKYKVISIFCDDPIKYIEFLEKYGLVQADNLLTVWDAFSRESPGEARRTEVNGINVFDVYDELVKMGMYDSKIVEI